MRIGVVGLGRIGAVHATNLADVGAVRELVLFDTDPQRLEGVHRPWMRIAPSLEALLSEVDAVVVATPTPTHEGIVRAAVNAGLPVLCEEPLTGEIPPMLQLVTDIEASGVPVMVGYQRRFDPTATELKRRVQAGELGRVHTIVVRTHVPATHEELVARYGANHDHLYPDQLIHDLDLVPWLVGRPVVAVHAAGGLPPGEPPQADAVETTAVTLTFDDGTLGVVLSGRTDGLGYDHRVEVHGSTDSLATGLDTRTPLTSLELDGPRARPEAYQDALERFSRAYAAEARVFTDLVAGWLAGQRGADLPPNPAPARDGLISMALAVACDASRRDHRVITQASPVAPVRDAESAAPSPAPAGRSGTTAPGQPTGQAADPTPPSADPSGPQVNTAQAEPPTGPGAEDSRLPTQPPPPTATNGAHPPAGMQPPMPPSAIPPQPGRPERTGVPGPDAPPAWETQPTPPAETAHDPDTNWPSPDWPAPDQVMRNGAGTDVFSANQFPSDGDGPGQVAPGQVGGNRIDPEPNGSLQTDPGRTGLGHTVPTAMGHVRPLQTAPTPSGSGQTDPGQIDPGHAGPAQTDPAQTDPAQTDPAQTDPAQTDPAQTDPGLTRPAVPGQPDPDRIDPSLIDPSRNVPGLIDPSRTHPGQTDPGQTGSSQAGSNQADRSQADPGQTDSDLDDPGQDFSGLPGPGPAGPGPAGPLPSHPASGADRRPEPSTPARPIPMPALQVTSPIQLMPTTRRNGRPRSAMPTDRAADGMGVATMADVPPEAAATALHPPNLSSASIPLTIVDPTDDSGTEVGRDLPSEQPDAGTLFGGPAPADAAIHTTVDQAADQAVDGAADGAPDAIEEPGEAPGVAQPEPLVATTPVIHVDEPASDPHAAGRPVSQAVQPASRAASADTLRLAGAPISWGVSDAPGWGARLQPERVLSDMAAVGLAGTELGPLGFLPEEPAALRGMLDRHGLRLAGGFTALALHLPEHAAEARARALWTAQLLASAGADVLAVAAVGGGRLGRPELDASDWRTLLGTVDDLAARMYEQHGVRLMLHPHIGTAVDRPQEIGSVLSDTGVPLCLDTGHFVLAGVDPTWLVREHAQRIGHVHLKDVDPIVAHRLHTRELGYLAAVRSGLYRPVGDGIVPMNEVVTGLRAAGYAGWWVLEHNMMLVPDTPPDRDPRTDTHRSVERARALIQPSASGRLSPTR